MSGKAINSRYIFCFVYINFYLFSDIMVFSGAINCIATRRFGQTGNSDVFFEIVTMERDVAS